MIKTAYFGTVFGYLRDLFKPGLGVYTYRSACFYHIIKQIEAFRNNHAKTDHFIDNTRLLYLFRPSHGRCLDERGSRVAV